MHDSRYNSIRLGLNIFSSKEKDWVWHNMFQSFKRKGLGLALHISFEKKRIGCGITYNIQKKRIGCSIHRNVTLSMSTIHSQNYVSIITQAYVTFDAIPNPFLLNEINLNH